MHQGTKLKFLIERSGKTKADVALLSGISDASLYTYMNSEEINSKKLKKICDVMGWELKLFYEDNKNLHTVTANYSEIDALKREIELLKDTIANKDEIIKLLKQTK
jgi:transcriptional regulator with XRE-family HTH domain